MNETTITPPATPPVTPPVETPPVVVAPVETPATPPAKPTVEPKKTGWIRVPQASFKARIQREADATLQKIFGKVPLTEAQRLFELGRKAEKGLLDSKATENEALQRIQTENAALKRRLDKSARELQVSAKKSAREARRLKDRQIEADLRAQAAMVGIKDPEYAIHLFAREVAAGKPADPKTFFAGLKASNAYLFGNVEPPPPQMLEPSTAPPESPAPGGVTPTPTGAGARGVVDTSSMSPQDFAAHTKAKYGFSPGMG